MNELQALCEAYLEERLDEVQRARLDDLLQHDAAARRYWVHYLHLHAGLLWAGAGAEAVTVPASPPEDTPAKRRFRWPGRLAAVLAVAAAALLAVWVAQRPGRRIIATLENTRSCKWDEGTLPTQAGADLVPGRLRLAEGLATLVFRSGASVTLEAPADLELVAADRCILHAGRLVARVPPHAVGFIVDTPMAVLVDRGTEFGVHVREDRTADVEVFRGAVDARHRVTGRMERLHTGASLRFSSDSAHPFDPQTERPPRGRPVGGDSGEVLHLSTATGRGKDAYVQRVIPAKHRSDILLLVKNAPPEKADFIRKAYVGIDLEPLAGRKVQGAQLTFTFTPTGMGFASEVPDATFAVYGLLDEALDDWDEKTIRWNNAPGNAAGGDLDTARVVLLGRFTIVQGEMQGTRSIRGEPLVRFLDRDTNGMATFLLVRETPGSGRNCLVHGFAGKNHPTSRPPTLEVSVAAR